MTGVCLDFPLALSRAWLYACCAALAMDALQQRTLGDVEPCGITGRGGREGKRLAQDLLCSPSGIKGSPAGLMTQQG